MITMYCASCEKEFECELGHLGPEPGEKEIQVTCPYCKIKWRLVIQFGALRA